VTWRPCSPRRIGSPAVPTSGASYVPAHAVAAPSWWSTSSAPATGVPGRRPVSGSWSAEPSATPWSDTASSAACATCAESASPCSPREARPSCARCRRPRPRPTRNSVQRSTVVCNGPSGRDKGR
jgi:hypothetical protein